MVLLQDLAPGYDTIKDISGIGAFIFLAIWMLRESKKRQEELQKNNEALITQIQNDHKESRDKLMELHQKTIEKHEECSERYAELLSKCNGSIDNNTRVMEKLSDRIR